MNKYLLAHPTPTLVVLASCSPLTELGSNRALSYEQRGLAPINPVVSESNSGLVVIGILLRRPRNVSVFNPAAVAADELIAVPDRYLTLGLERLSGIYNSSTRISVMVTDNPSLSDLKTKEGLWTYAEIRTSVASLVTSLYTHFEWRKTCSSRRNGGFSAT